MARKISISIKSPVITTISGFRAFILLTISFTKSLFIRPPICRSLIWAILYGSFKCLIFISTFSSFTNLASYKERAISVEATAKEEISSVFFKKNLLESEIGAKESKTLDMS